MKTIGNIIMVTLLAFVMLYGVVIINERAAVNTVLDEDSLNMIAQYDSEYATFAANVTTIGTNTKNLDGYEPDANLIGDFAKDFFETKSRIDQLKTTVSLAYNLPDIFFLSIPFVDEDDLTIYKQVSLILLIIVIFVALILAFTGRIWGSQGK